MGGLVGYEEVVRLRCFGKVIVVALGEVVLKLLHQVAVSSLAGSAQHHHSNYYFLHICLMLDSTHLTGLMLLLVTPSPLLG